VNYFGVIEGINKNYNERGREGWGEDGIATQIPGYYVNRSIMEGRID